MSELTGTTEFQGDIEKLCGKLDINIETARKKIAFDLHAGVVKRSPVDTGRFRANWDLTAGAPSQMIDEMPDLKKGDAISPPTMPEVQAKEGESYFIINNLPYAEPLEHGHSNQAPAGMVEPTMIEVAAQIATIVGAPE
jgi:hypothetical protein